MDSRLSLNWNLNRAISKMNYRIHTDAIKENLIPPELTSAQIAYTYANWRKDMFSQNRKKRVALHFFNELEVQCRFAMSSVFIFPLKVGKHLSCFELWRGRYSGIYTGG